MPSAPRPRSRSSALSTRKKFCFAAIALAIFCVGIEGCLAIVGVRPDVTRDPYVGFSNYAPVMQSERDASGREVLTTVPAKQVWFNRQSFPRIKPAGTRRVICVGGSTTYGRPFADPTSYSGFLRQLLPIADPSHAYEVINAGGVSYASYRVAAVMEEFAQYDPDLFIVYSVHNEFLERRTYSSMYERSQWQMSLESWLRKTRSWTAVEKLISMRQDDGAGEILSTEVDERLNHTPGPSDYERDDDWTAKVLRHYEFNLQRMVRIARDCGAEIVFVEPACNEKDCSPFKSDEPYYQDGRDLFELGLFEDARIAFQAAIDRDICPLRATTAIGAILRRVASSNHVPCVPLERRLRATCEAQYGHQCLGDEFFVDHVHPTIEVHRDLATWIIDSLSESGWIDGNRLTQAAIQKVDDQVRSEIDAVDHGVSLRNLAKVMHWSGKFDEARRRALDALQILPNDPESRYVLADCLTRLNRVNEAIEQYEILFQQTDYERAILPYGELLAYNQQYERAKVYLIMATASEKVRVRTRAFESLAQVHEALGEWELAAEARRQL